MSSLSERSQQRINPQRIPAVGDSSRRLPADLQWRLFILLLLFSDLVMISLALGVAYWVRFELGLPIFMENVFTSGVFYRQLAMGLVPIWLIIFAVIGLYRREDLLGGPKEYSRVLRGTTGGLILFLVAEFLFPAFTVARGWVLLSWFFTVAAVSFGRFLLRRLIYQLRRKGYYLVPALIVGTNGEGLSLAQQLLSWTTSGLDIVGFVDDNRPPGTEVLEDLKTLGPKKELKQLVDRYDVKELILATSSLSRDEILEIFEQFGFSEEVNLRMSSGLFEIITTGLNVKEFAYVPLVGVNKLRLTGSDRIAKTALDYALTLPALLLLLPVMAILSISIRLDSAGPAIHRRRVLGVNGRSFDAYKFRTMYVNGDEILEQHPELKKELAENHKLREDPRVTRVGSFLRKYSLDELPQLFNVLKNEMSLVGPRMISPQEIQKYEPWGLNLLTVRPGLTGLWQVSGRSDISYDDRVRMDMHYIRNWTIWLDLQLLWQTIPVVLKGQGAY